MATEILGITPLLPSQNITRDVEWYNKYVGFELVHNDDMYAVLKRETHFIHLQWHADTDDDPLLGGSVVKIFVKNIQSIYEEFVKRGTIKPEKLNLGTPWNTNEFGFYDLNNNALFFVEGL